MINNLTVILDSGHGKETPGKRSPKLEDGSQLMEWEFTRDLSNRIKGKLFSNGIKCIQANTDSIDRSLSDRAKIINEIYAKEKQNGNTCICISLHGNAAGSGNWEQATGWEVWTTEKKNNSDKLATEFIKSFPEIFPDKKLRGHKEKNFTLLYKLNCPCVLTENFFYDNKDECKFMLSDSGLNKLAELHVDAIKNYIKNN